MGAFDSVYAEIGSQIRELRNKKGITQERLAELVSLTRTSITNIEKGRQKLPIHTLYVFANALGVAPRDLLPEIKKTKQILQNKALKHLSKNEVKWIEAVMKGGASYENQEADDSKDGTKPA
jgi:transcriptional regulator with XRE-family HTH domain